MSVPLAGCQGGCLPRLSNIRRRWSSSCSKKSLPAVSRLVPCARSLSTSPLGWDRSRLRYMMSAQAPRLPEAGMEVVFSYQLIREPTAFQPYGRPFRVHPLAATES